MNIPLEHDGGVEERGGRDGRVWIWGGRGKRGKKEEEEVGGLFARERLSLSGAVLPMVP